MPELRQIATDVFKAAVDRADPDRAVRLAFSSQPLPALKDGRCFVLAIGKAAAPMMRAALDLIPEVHRALVITNPENLCEIEGAEVLAGSHPVPDEASAAAGRAVLDLLAETRPGDRVVALISGGGSALMVAPAPGLTLADKAAVNALLLASGLEINDMNLIRQHLSDSKGGGLLRHAAPAQVYGFLLSDVIGDDLRAIASGPTVAPIGTKAEAIKMLKSVSLWDAVPDAVRSHLKSEDAETPDLPAAHNQLIGSNRHSLQAMVKAVPQQFKTQIVSDALVGDVHDAAEEILKAGEASTGPVALIFGGETTVQLKGTGRGGRNQELALLVANGAEGRLPPGWVFLSGGTDGRDGPTDSAGGLVDSGTLARVDQAGGDFSALLANNDSYAALKLADDLLITGGTGTNVADVQIFLRG
ncbi:MAG: glycerate kinase type-2 family protein [Cognatishimia sp.]